MPKEKLARVLGLGALIIYGVGDILGAGIYAIIGKIAGLSGPLTWLSFAIALFIVFLTALCYCELVSRFPKSGGVSIYIQEAFERNWLSILVGLLLFSATILSMSTLSQAFVGYLKTFGFNIPRWAGTSGFFIVMIVINVRGIKQSSLANIISTTIEVAGLIIVLALGLWYLLNTNMAITHLQNHPDIKNILKGTALAFFAFTGFEDLVNIAEEVKKPERSLPRAILTSLVIAGFLYVAVSWTSTSIIPAEMLAKADGPLLEVVSKAYPPMPVYIFSIIAIFAIFNTALLNYVTASRLLYGMSEAKLLPRFFQILHHKYQTPYVAIFTIFPLILLLGLVGTLGGLARFTSAIVLAVFSLSSIALIKIKSGDSTSHGHYFRIPLFVPWVALGLNLTAIVFLIVAY